jgi:hypothetical protein
MSSSAFITYRQPVETIDDKKHPGSGRLMPRDTKIPLSPWNAQVCQGTMQRWRHDAAELRGTVRCEWMVQAYLPLVVGGSTWEELSVKWKLLSFTGVLGRN